MEEQLKSRLRFLTTIDKMKSIYRRNVIADGSGRGETDAEHSWHLALYAMTLAEYAPAGTDIDRTIRICLTHDLVEVYAGDTFCYDAAANADKKERETAAAEKLFSVLPPAQKEEFEGLWREFEENATNEARFANALDRMQPFLLNAETDFHTWHLNEITDQMIFRREEPVRAFFPEVYRYVEECVERALERGLLKKEEAKAEDGASDTQNRE